MSHRRHKLSLQLARAHMEQTVNNIEIFNYVINIFVLSAIIEKVGGGSKGIRAVDGNYDPICSGLMVGYNWW